MSNRQKEPLLTPNDNRFVMFPIKDQEVWKMYKKMMDSFWRAEEIDFSKDQKHWESLNDDEKFFKGYDFFDDFLIQIWKVLGSICRTWTMHVSVFIGVEAVFWKTALWRAANSEFWENFSYVGKTFPIQRLSRL